MIIELVKTVPFKSLGSIVMTTVSPVSSGNLVHFARLSDPFPYFLVLSCLLQKFSHFSIISVADEFSYFRLNISPTVSTANAFVENL
jgi:hypothetical protein